MNAHNLFGWCLQWVWLTTPWTTSDIMFLPCYDVIGHCQRAVEFVLRLTHTNFRSGKTCLLARDIR